MENIKETAERVWGETKTRSVELVGSGRDMVKRHPQGTVLAIGAGFALGMFIQWLLRPREREIDLEHKPTLEDARFHLGALALPFLWPAYQRARREYERSARKAQAAYDRAQSVYERVKRADRQKLAPHPIETAEQWIEKEARPMIETGWSRLRNLFS